MELAPYKIQKIKPPFVLQLSFLIQECVVLHTGLYTNKIDLQKSWMVGDKINDLIAANSKNLKRGLKNFKSQKIFQYTIVDNFFNSNIAKKLEIKMKERALEKRSA